MKVTCPNPECGHPIDLGGNSEVVLGRDKATVIRCGQCKGLAGSVVSNRVVTAQEVRGKEVLRLHRISEVDPRQFERVLSKDASTPPPKEPPNDTTPDVTSR